MALGSITIDLLLKTGAFDNDAKRAEKRLAELGKSAKAAGVVIGTALSAAVLGASAAIKSSINAMDDMSKAALRAGASTEEFSKLAYAGDLADVAMSDLVGSLGKLQKAQGDALKETSQQAKIFDALGISVKNADGTLRSSTDVLYDFADAYKALDGSPEATAAGMAIFGRSFQNLIPLIKDGSQGLRDAGDELERFGGVLSTDAGLQAEAFNDNLSRLTKQSGIFWQLMASNLLPDLERLSAKFVDNAAGAERMASAANDAANGVRFLAGAFTAIYSVIDWVGDGISGMTEQLYGFYYAADQLAKGNWAGVKSGLKLGFAGGDRDPYKSQAAPTPVLMSGRDAAPDSMFKMSQRELELMGQKDAIQRRLLEINAKQADGAKKASKAAVQALTEEERALKSLLQSYGSQQASMERSIALHGDASNSARISYEIQAGALVGLADAEAMRLKGLAATLDILDYMDEAESVIADNAKAAADKAEAAFRAMSVYAEQAGRNMQDAFADFLFDPFKDGLDGMLENFAKILQRMAAEMAASKIFEAMGNAGAANSGTWWGSLLSAFGGGRAAGGPVDKSKLYEVGEGGRPELLASGGKTYLIPGNNGTVIPASASAGNSVPGMAGGGEVNVNVYNAPAGADVQTRKNDKGGMDIDVILRQVDQYIGGNVASGSGATYSSMKNRFGLREAI